MLVKEFPKIVPAFGEYYHNDAVNDHLWDLPETLERFIPPQVFQQYYSNPSIDVLRRALESLNSILPMVQRQVDDRAPGTMSLFLLCKVREPAAAIDFVSQMVEHWLVPGRHLFVLSSKNHLFRFDQGGADTYLAMEMVVAVERDRDLAAVRRNVSSLVEEIRLGLRMPSEAFGILEGKGLSSNQKWRMVQERLFNFIHRRPRLFSSEAISELQHLRLHVSEEFIALRTSQHICRITTAHHWFRRDVHRQLIITPNRRHVRVKLRPTQLQFPFGLRNVLGVVISLNFIKSHELIEDQHILRAVSRIVPDAKLVPSSFFLYRQSNDVVRSVYVEIEKESGKPFQRGELQRLGDQLPGLIQGSVETLVRSVFMRRNEEEVFQNILRLSRELKFVGDIPQVHVSFYGQAEDHLVFNVQLVRILKSNSDTIQDLVTHLPEGVQFHVEQVRPVGLLRKRYRKEATVCTVSLQKEAFFRRDHSIDLYRARKFVVGLLVDRLGEVRDYNGGLILKQSELLSAVKQLLRDAPENDEFLLENFFYSLTPVVMQTLLDPGKVKALFLLLLEALESQPLRQQRYLIRLRQEPDCVYVMLRSEDSSYTEKIHAFLAMQDFGSNEQAYSYVDANGSYCLGCVYLSENPEAQERFREGLMQTMEEWHRERKAQQTLRINLLSPSVVLDPRMGTRSLSGILIQMLYEGLTRVSPNGEPEYGLAQSIHISNDLCTYTFNLREAQWTNGLPVTAYDFEYAWLKYLDPNADARFAYLFYPIHNAKAARQGDCSLEEVGICAIDERTLVVDLDHPAPYFLELTAHWCFSPLCRQVDEKHPGWAHYGQEGFVSNGPFRLAQWDRSQGLKVVKNLDYWDADEVKLDGIQVSSVQEPREAFSMYKNDELDWIGDPVSPIPQEELERLVSEGKVQRQPVAANYWYDFNVDCLPFSSSKIRKAFTYAVNRRRLIAEVLPGDEIVSTSILPDAMSLQKQPWFEDGNVELAKKLFEEGLAELELSKSDLPVITISYDSTEGMSPIHEHIAQQWRDAFGLHVNCEGYEGDAYLERLVRLQAYQVGSASWFSWFNDPIYNLQHLKTKDNGINSTQWEHPEFIRLLNRSDRNIDARARLGNLWAAEKLLMDEMPICPLFAFNYRYLSKPQVKGVYISATGQIDFRWASIEY